MGFLIKMAFWFSVVLLLLPLDSDGGPGINPLQAFFAAKEAVGDVAGICERKPEVCEVGKAAMQTIGARAKEGARIAYEMLEENGSSAPAADIDSLLDAEDIAAAGSQAPAAPSENVPAP